MNRSIISIAGIDESIVDGEGLRIAIFGAGCSHKCKNCHNPQTWNINNGTWLSVETVYNETNRNNPIISGITFTGGDPMYQAGAFTELAKMIKHNTNYDIWCYTGYLFEDIADSRDEKFQLLKNIDVLVDGRYIDELRDVSLAFRGSQNQRIIDVKQSLQQNDIVEYTLHSLYSKL